ncbi:MAG TPA: hypothetical protein VFN68_05665, partial [Acidimicrobiales bacterium]|nr:hypothetical protein [Acidimicrobiales bacterium]
AAGVVWYARSSYFVGLQGDSIVVYQGRPGGVLWFQPTLAARTGHTTADVLPSTVPTIRSGQVEPSVAAAQAYVARSVAAEQQALAVAGAAPAGISSATTAPIPPTTAAG